MVLSPARTASRTSVEPTDRTFVNAVIAALTATAITVGAVVLAARRLDDETPPRRVTVTTPRTTAGPSAPATVDTGDLGGSPHRSGNQP